MYRAASLMTVLREQSGYRLHLVGVQEDRGTAPAGEYIFFFVVGSETMN
jgi:hypothetical protein